VGDLDTMRLLLEGGRDVDAPGPEQLNVRSVALALAALLWLH
jgi:hypothetical protein